MAVDQVYKITLSTKRVVHMREMKLKYQQLAIKAVGKKAQDNDALLGSMVIAELIKMLIVDIDGARQTAAQLEDLDGLFSYKEITELNRTVTRIMGGDDVGELQMEIVNIGGPLPGSVATPA